MTNRSLFLTPESFEQIRTGILSNKPLITSITLDIGITRTRVSIQNGLLISPDQSRAPLPLQILETGDDRTIFKLEESEWVKWQRFDSEKNRFYKMIYVASGKPPTIEISGIKMHVTEGSDPQKDTENKLDSLRRLKGTVLDTCMGLGYSAIAAAMQTETERVFTCEKDINILRFARENPWSVRLFDHPKLLPVVIEVQDYIKTLPDNFLDTIIHDPPRYALAPELYNINFYRQLYRVMKSGAEIYHYTGNPNQYTRKESLSVKTARRLKEAGFDRVRSAYFGTAARK